MHLLFICTYTYRSIDGWTHVYTYVCIDEREICIISLSLYIHLSLSLSLYIYIYICMYVCMYVYIHIYIYIHTRTRTRTRARTRRGSTPRHACSAEGKSQAVVCVPSLVYPGGGSVLAPSARGDLS